MKSDIDLLRAQVKALSARLDQRALQTNVIQQYVQLIIDVGNTLATGQAGCKGLSAGSIPTSFPTAYNATTDTSYIDGVCRAQIYFNGVYGGYVVVVNQLGVALLQGDPYTYVGFPNYMPVTASTAVVQYYNVGP